MKTKKITAIVLSMVMLLTLLTGCGMNKEKAIEQMGEALNAGYEMNSGKISAQMNAQVTLGEDSIPMELAIDGAVKDQMQTMAMKISGTIMGMPIDSEVYQLDGFSYTKDPSSEQYIKIQSPTAMMDYQKLLTLGQDEMVDLYIEGAKAAEDFAFAEEEKGLRVSFTMPQEQLEGMQQSMSSMMIDDVIPAMEEQMRASVKEQVNAMMESMQLDPETMSQDQLDALIEQQIAAVVEMEKQLFNSLKISGINCDMLIENGVINDQTMKMDMEFALKGLVEALGVTETTDIPETCALSMEIHSLIENRNEDIEIEMPEFTSENVQEM